MKAEVDKLDIHELADVPTCVNNLKMKIDGFNVCKLKALLIDFKRSSDVKDKKSC